MSSANRGNVDAVMVDGQFVKRHGALVDIDTAGIRDELMRARERLFAAGGYDDIEPKLTGKASHTFPVGESG